MYISNCCRKEDPFRQEGRPILLKRLHTSPSPSLFVPAALGAELPMSSRACHASSTPALPARLGQIEEVSDAESESESEASYKKEILDPFPSSCVKAKSGRSPSSSITSRSARKPALPAMRSASRRYSLGSDGDVAIVRKNHLHWLIVLASISRRGSVMYSRLTALGNQAP